MHLLVFCIECPRREEFTLLGISELALKQFRQARPRELGVNLASGGGSESRLADLISVLGLPPPFLTAPGHIPAKWLSWTDCSVAWWRQPGLAWQVPPLWPLAQRPVPLGKRGAERPGPGQKRA